MANAFKSVRGMHDLLPETACKTRVLENKLSELAALFGYNEIRTPLVEHLGLFKRSAGEASDIVQKEMYAFSDQNGDELALRPEGTAACVRAGIEHSLFYGKRQRLWYLGSMFRRERPQKGRYRQFNQFGLEALGFSEPYIELEIIQAVEQLFSTFGLETCLELNHLGSISSRQNFIRELLEYLSGYEHELDEDSKQRLKTNPLRIFDSKVEHTQKILTDAPKISNFLAHDEQKEFDFVINNLIDLGISHRIQPKLVRGLDYYTASVFEWQHKNLTICAGGRYNNLVAQLGGKPCPAVGVALGIERLLEAIDCIDRPERPVAILCNYGPAYVKACEITRALRANAIAATLDFNAEKLKPLLKIANNSGCKYAILYGENEFNNATFTLKDMGTAEHIEFTTLDKLLSFLEEHD